MIRISNLVDSISQAEIHRLFGPDNDLGRIERLFLARDAEGTRKGFGYITYKRAVDAANAIAKMNKRAFKHVILMVDYGTPQSQINAARRQGGR